MTFLTLSGSLALYVSLFKFLVKGEIFLENLSHTLDLQAFSYHCLVYSNFCKFILPTARFAI